MDDIVARLRDCAIEKSKEAWSRIDGGADLCIGSMLAEELAEEAADEIERLRNILCEANNRWRHDFGRKIDAATDELFGKLAAHRTDPFGRRKDAAGGIQSSPDSLAKQPIA